jgi:hypothetical protein
VRLTNVGTAAVYYRWSRVDRGGPAGLEGVAPEVAAPRELSRFECANANGSVLPGRKLDVSFTFASPNPVRRAVLLLHLSPLLA